MRLALALVLVGCSSSSVLTGNGADDLETLTAMVEVDCSTELVCGAAPRCLTDALHAGQIATVRREQKDARPWPYIEHLFTYDGAVVVFKDVRPAMANIAEFPCRGIAAVLMTDGCYSWEAQLCDGYP